MRYGGYYLTAYGIAVKHGFTGTEEEWIKTLGVKDMRLAEDGSLVIVYGDGRESEIGQRVIFVHEADHTLYVGNSEEELSTEEYINSVNVAGTDYPIRDAEADTMEAISGGYYNGTDLTVKFADEIAASPYFGDPWAWIQARIQAGVYAGIHVADYIPFDITIPIGDPAVDTTYTFRAMIAGINTYTNSGDYEGTIGNHIDFVSKELWPVTKPYNAVRYNNGTAAQPSPWLASDVYHWLNSLSGTVPSSTAAGGGTGTAVDYTTDGVYYYLPATLKNVITEKATYYVTRYSEEEILPRGNGSAWGSIGKLWLPHSVEVCGNPINCDYVPGWRYQTQYPLFRNKSWIRKARNGGGVANWWCMNPREGDGTADADTTYCIYTDLRGYIQGSYANYANGTVPICFRIA